MTIKEIRQEVDEMLGLKHGGVEVITTSDMLAEEEEFELTAGFLKEGYTVEESKKKAKEWREKMDTLFNTHH